MSGLRGLRNGVHTLALLGAVAGFAMMAEGVRGDVVVRKDGKTFHGNIVSVDEGVVVLDLEDSKVSLRMKIARGEIASYQRDAVYMMETVRGEVGKEVTAESVSRIVQSARQRGAQHLVLDLNVTEGSVEEAVKIAAVLGGTKDIGIIGFVGSVTGPGAIVALSCRHLVMRPTGRIVGGSAMEEEDRPEFGKSLVAAAKAGGHPSLVARALSGAGGAVSLVSEGGKEILVEGREPGGTVLCDNSGRTLVLSGETAVSFGMAEGSASGVEEVGKAIGFASWREYSNKGVVKSEMTPPPKPKGSEGGGGSTVRVGSAGTGVVTAAERSEPAGARVQSLAGAEQQYRAELEPIEKRHNAAMSRIQKDYANNPAGRRSAELSEDRSYTAQKEQARQRYEKARK